MRKIDSCCAASALVFLATTVVQAEDVSGLTDWFKNGSTGIDFRYRLETVDQDGVPFNATASTLLTKLYYTTASMNGFSAYAEFANVTIIGKETFNDTINGRVRRPVIADPEGTEISQAYLTYKHEGLMFKFGRQGFNLDNQRFVGTVAFRQNDQTYDSVSLTYAPDKDLKAFYGYVWNVNRIFGNNSPKGDLDTNLHLFNLSYSASSLGTLSTYAYLLDFDDPGALGLSSATYGARFSGTQAANDAFNVSYTAEYAKQTDYKDNPRDFSTDYLHGELNVSVAGLTGGVAYEQLGSDNGAAFQTPLATLHKFNGWADVFLSTPAAGLQDLNVSVAYRVQGSGPLSGTLFKVIYHDFSSDVGDQNYGDEWGLLISKKLNKAVTASAKAAFYNADAFATDRTRFWFTIGARF